VIFPRPTRHETFNVMKNHGYELEHNFGHGETFLAMTLAALNLLAFAWHSALDIVEPPWQVARQAAAKRSSFFAHILTLASYVVFPSWLALLGALATCTIPPQFRACRLVHCCIFKWKSFKPCRRQSRRCVRR
jgi:hypothetical protein